MDAELKRHVTSDLLSLIDLARSAIGITGDPQITRETLRTDLHAMRAILNRIERRLDTEPLP